MLGPIVQAHCGALVCCKWQRGLDFLASGDPCRPSEVTRESWVLSGQKGGAYSGHHAAETGRTRVTRDRREKDSLCVSGVVRDVPSSDSSLEKRRPAKSGQVRPNGAEVAQMAPSLAIVLGPNSDNLGADLWPNLGWTRLLSV